MLHHWINYKASLKEAGYSLNHYSSLIQVWVRDFSAQVNTGKVKFYSPKPGF